MVLIDKIKQFLNLKTIKTKTMKKIFLIVILLSTFCCFSQKITQSEYFWDTDPGQGNGIALQAFDGNFNQSLESIFNNNTTLPSIGNHIIGIRIKGQEGNWSPIFKKLIRINLNNNSNNQVKITIAEYFWDIDPGQGAGNLMLAFDGNFNQALETVMSNNTSLPNIGNHSVGIRVKDDDGNWSTTYRKVFRVSDNNNSNNVVKVTAAEYYWDTDPGQGAANSMLVFDGNFNQAIESVMANNATLPSVGDHTIGIRIKADDGNWGTTYRKVFRLSENNNSNNTVKIKQAEYFWNNDPGEGNGTTMLAFDANFNQALETIVANNVAFPELGLNVLRVRVKTEDGNWGITYSKVVGVNITYNELVTLVSPTNGASNVPTNSSFVWNLLTGAGTYEYQCATDNSFTSIIQTGSVAGTSIPFSSLSTNTTYYWRVRANVANNVSLWSPIWSFTTNSTLDNPYFEISRGIKIFPNPSNSFLHIETSLTISEISVLDLLGKRIHINKISNNYLDISSLAQGIYMIKVKDNNNKIFYTKFIKK